MIIELIGFGGVTIFALLIIFFAMNILNPSLSMVLFFTWIALMIMLCI